MGLINCCLIWYTVFGMAVSVSPSAFRNLNRKVNLLKTTFQRELDSQRATFQREIDDLKYEVLDLKTELHIEKTKTARLQELLNGTDSAEETASRNVDSEILQQHDQQLNQLNESIHSLEIDIDDNKKAVQIAKELQQEMVVCRVLRKAFQEEKKHNQHRKKHIMTESTGDEKTNHILSVGITNVRNEMEVLSKQVAKYTDDIATLRNDLTDQDQSINETLHETLRKFRQQSRLSSEMAGQLQTIKQKLTTVDATIAEIAEKITAPQKSVEDGTVDHRDVETTTEFDFFDLDYEIIKTTTDHSLDGLHTRCLEAIRAGGEAMAKLLYVGVTVKRGKDWKWHDQDGGGQGKVTVLPEDITTHWVRVRWDNDYSNVYRMGLQDAYDLLIVEEKFDFSRCK